MQTPMTFIGFVEAIVDSCYRTVMWIAFVAVWISVVVLGVSIFISAEVSFTWKFVSAPGFMATLLILTLPFVLPHEGASNRAPQRERRRLPSLGQLSLGVLSATVATVYLATGFYLLASDMDWLWKFVIVSIWAPVMIVVGGLWLMPLRTVGAGIPAELMEAGRVARDIFILNVNYENQAVCKVCGSTIEERKVLCRRCYTPHHRDCWTFSGKCAVYACGEKHFLVPREQHER
jgi:hypothetical protein